MADNLAVDKIGLERAESRLAKSLAGFKLRDTTFHLLTLAAAWAVLILLGGVIAYSNEIKMKLLGVKREDLFRRPSIPCCDTRTESEMLAEFPWEGHWEVWEREWVGARWVWDVRASRLGVSKRAFVAGKAA